MDIHLREWKADAVLGKLVVELLIVIIEDVPVLGSAGPCTYLKVDAGLVQIV